jgi:hypothetical protein
MNNTSHINCYWYPCKHSKCLHLVLGNATLTFLPEQLLVLASVIDEMRQEVLTKEQLSSFNIPSTNLLM